MAKESLRNAYGQALVRLGRENANLVVFDADLAKSTQTLHFGKAFSDRYIDMGLAEQDMISTAAGVALTGKTVFASSFCVFLAGRVFDQVRQSVCYNNADVKLVATHSGLGVGEDGATHQSLEDVALMRTLPNMRVIVPADAVETVSVIEYVASEYGPFYVRLTRSNLETVHPPTHRFTPGKATVLRDGEDVTIAAAGAMVEKALQAQAMLAEAGISAAVLNCAAIKPLDGDTLLHYARRTRGIVCAEDHSVSGGLGGAVAEFLGRHHPTPLRLVGVENQFGRSGTPEELYKAYNLTAERIAAECRSLLDRP